MPIEIKQIVVKATVDNNTALAANDQLVTQRQLLSAMAEVRKKVLTQVRSELKDLKEKGTQR